jgi:hypothetical protein
MAMSQAAWKAEQALGHGDNANTAQDVTNPGLKAEWGNSNETMKALAWMGKNKVEVGMYKQLHAIVIATLMSANQKLLKQQSTARNPRSSRTAM